MTRFIRRLAILGMMVVTALILQGCTVDGGDDVIIVDDSEPAAPRGVYSITGDEEVTVIWYPNQERDLDGYYIYRALEGSDEYVEIGVVDADSDSFVDEDVRNGITYFYAVSAFDTKGNESELSPEIEDTPRPAGRNVKLEDFIVEPNRSGFDFDHPERGAQPFDRSGIDMYFGVGLYNDELYVPRIYSDNEDVKMQDLGYTDSMDDIDVSPTEGFIDTFMEAIIGHTYAFFTPNGNFAKIRVTDIQITTNDDVEEAWIVFDWAFQLQEGNPELAPAKN